MVSEIERWTHAGLGVAAGLTVLGWLAWAVVQTKRGKDVGWGPTSHWGFNLAMIAWVAWDLEMSIRVGHVGNAWFAASLLTLFIIIDAAQLVRWLRRRSDGTDAEVKAETT